MWKKVLNIFLMCLSGDCENCRAQALAASKAAEADSRRHYSKKKPPERYTLLKLKYATAVKMLANAEQYGGTLAVLELLSRQTEAGG